MATTRLASHSSDSIGRAGHREDNTQQQRRSCSLSIGAVSTEPVAREQVSASGAQVLLIASCTDASRLPKLLRATGRLDHFIEVGTPNTAERCGMIEHMLRLRGLKYEVPVVEHVARRTEGFDSSDLAVVMERAVHEMRLEEVLARGPGGQVGGKAWDAALSGFQPSAAWHAGAQDSIDGRCVHVVGNSAVCLCVLRCTRACAY
jgi:SpoVK/Ycf46/Vps4 family AAA+-type ATPase